METIEYFNKKYSFLTDQNSLHDSWKIFFHDLIKPLMAVDPKCYSYLTLHTVAFPTGLVLMSACFPPQGVRWILQHRMEYGISINILELIFRKDLTRGLIFRFKNMVEFEGFEEIMGEYDWNSMDINLFILFSNKAENWSILMYLIIHKKISVITVKDLLRKLISTKIERQLFLSSRKNTEFVEWMKQQKQEKN